MDPVSILGLVCAIVSAFTETASLFRERKARKKAKTQHARAAAALRHSLAIAPLQVQQEYDYDFGRIGERFAIGDDVGRSQLLNILINLQMKLIGTVQALLSLSGRSSYASMLNASDSSRHATIAALSSQFQRLWQAAPISRPTQAVPSRNCVLWNDTDQGVFRRECYATESGDQGGILRLFPIGSHCKVLEEADINNVWIQDAKLPGRYKVPKQNLSRMRHFWRDTDQGKLGKSCTAIQGWTLRGFKVKRGRACTVFDADLDGPHKVWVKFTFSNSEWDSNVGYLVPKKYLRPVYSTGHRSAPTSVYVA